MINWWKHKWWWLRACKKCSRNQFITESLRLSVIMMVSVRADCYCKFNQFHNYKQTVKTVPLQLHKFAARKCILCRKPPCTEGACPYSLWRWWSYKCLEYLSPQCYLLFFSLLKVLFTAHPFCPFGLAEDKRSSCFKCCCPLLCHVYLESPLWQREPQVLEKETKKINVHTTGLSLMEDEQREAVTMIPTSSGEQMSGRTGARRSSVQPQPRPSKVPWSLPFFLVRCFLRMIRRLGLWSLLSSNAAAAL